MSSSTRSAPAARRRTSPVWPDRRAIAATIAQYALFGVLGFAIASVQVLPSYEFMRLSDRRILMIVVSPEGDVHNRILLVERPYSQSQLIEAGNVLNQQFAGMSFEDRVPDPKSKESGHDFHRAR